MSEAPSCSQCQSTELRWRTDRKGPVPIDVLECGACRTPLLEEDWMAPVMPYVPGRCINCGERREYDTCPNCGLNRDEDAQVHDELRFMVSPDHSLFDAARIANKAGRHLMALKLATAATAVAVTATGAIGLFGIHAFLQTITKSLF